MAVDTADVAAALRQLYDPLSSPRVRRRADSLLQRFQRTPEAAQSALLVLRAPPAAVDDPHVRAERAFAAATVYATVASYVRAYRLEAPEHWTPDERALHERLAREFAGVCQEVWNVLTGPHGAREAPAVQTQLALAVAVILLRFHEQHADATIVGAVEWLVANQASPAPAEDDGAAASRTNFAVLLTLKVLPEEVANRRVKFAKPKREQCEALVRQSAPYVVSAVLPTLAAAIDADERLARLRGLLLQCLASWVEFGRVPPHVVVASGLLDRAFQETTSPLFSADALLCIREVVRACDSGACIPLMELVMRNFVLLGKHVLELVAAGDAGADCLKGCAVAAAECGQAFIVYFVDYTLDLHPGSLVYEFLDTVLAFTAVSDLEVSTETMAFWIDFRAYVSGKHERRMAAFEAFVARLLGILVERTEFPDGFETFPAAARDRFTSYRNDVRAVFRSLATVSQASEDRFVVDAIHVVFRQYELLDAGQAPPTWWKKVEVYVHALSAVSKSIREEDTSLVPQLFELLSRKEPSHPALSRTTTIFLGVMGHWFARNPSYLDVYAFRIISQSFEMSESHPTYPFRMRLHGEDHVGTVALKKLTQRCGGYFFSPPWLDAMLGLYRSSRTAPGKTARLTGDSVVMVVESVANVAATVSYADAAPVVEQLCASMFLDLTTRFPVLSAADDASVELVCEVLEHLHVLAAKLPPQINQEAPHPVLCVLRTHWDGVEGILREYGATADVAAKFSALLVALFESIRSQALELAAALMPHVLEQFARSLDGSFLAVIKSIIACAGDDDAADASLTRVLVIVSERALGHLAAAGSAAVDEHAALVVALLDLARCCGARRPRILVRSQQLEPLLALVLHALASQQPDVGFAALDFLADVGAWYGHVLRMPADQLRSSGELAGHVELHELIRTLFFDKDVQYQLLVALFHAAGGALPPALVERVAEVVRSCWACFGRQRSEELVARLLADDAFAGAHVALRARAEFAGTIAKPECIENARKFKRVLTAFCDHFRKSLAASASATGATAGATMGVVSS